MQLRRILLMSAFTAAGLPLLGQTTNLAHPTPVAATAPTAVPALVPYNAIAEGNDGKALSGEVSMTFMLFKDETGGEPLWTESQRVNVDSLGHYGVQLGSSSPSGMPLTVFASGEARWLEVQVAGQKQQARVLLSSVPYAAKAADSATLGGLPASAFMLAGTAEAVAASSPNSITPNTTSNVTTTGGTDHYLPKFSGTSTVINSQIYDTGTSVGIGDIPNASVKLDVGGGMIMRGPMIVSRTDNATPSQAFPSFGFAFYSNVYDSGTHATDNPHYLLQSEPAGNNTSNTSATFNLLYSNHGSTPAETGFYVNTNGTVHFASGQTFPGTGDGDITSVTAGTGLSGGGTSGAVTLSNAGILALTANSGVKSSGGQSPTLTIDTTKIPTLTDNPVFTGSITVNSNSASVAAVTGNGTSGGIGLYGTSDTEWAGRFDNSGSEYASIFSTSEATSGGWSFFGRSAGTDSDDIYSYAEGAGGYGLAAYAYGGPDSDGNPAVGAFGQVESGYGVEGFGISGTGVLGVNDTASGTFQSLAIDDGYVAGVWADTASPLTEPDGSLGALVATADNNFAGYLLNDSDSYGTLNLYNYGTAGLGTDIAGVLKAGNAFGSCGIGGKGNLTCTGQVKTLATTSGSRKVETYAMQSPENWMEDFGSGSLKSGTATISIDPAFAETANTGADYHVFITPNGDSKGLYIMAKSATSFEVRESNGGTSSLLFDYRIVAKRKGYEAQRLVDVTERFNAENAHVLTRERLQAAKANRIGKRAMKSAPRGPQVQGGRHPIAATVTQRHTGN